MIAKLLQTFSCLRSVHALLPGVIAAIQRMVEPEDSPSAKKFIEQIREDAELNGVFYLDEGDGEDEDPSAARIMTLSEAEAYVSWAGLSDDSRSDEIDGDGNGECLHISWHEIFTRSITVELAR